MLIIPKKTNLFFISLLSFFQNSKGDKKWNKLNSNCLVNNTLGTLNILELIKPIK